MSKLIIKSLRDGYRRAGIAFGRAGVIVETDDLTEQQIEAIQGDPNLKTSAAPDEADEARSVERATADAELAAARRAEGASALADAKASKRAAKGGK